MNKTLVWMNGSYVNYNDARISIEDRGFQFSDGIYEVIRAFGGRFFAFDEHLQRLRRSLQSVEINVSLTDKDFRTIADQLLVDSGNKDVTLYIQITRGTAPRSHLLSKNISPTIIFVLRAFQAAPEELYSQGVRVITLKDERWLRCDIKTTGLLANVLARERAQRAGAQDAIFVRDGWVTEGTSTNVFVVRDHALTTPVADHRILKGVTRDIVLSLARQSKMSTAESDVSLGEVLKADEVFLTSTTMDVLPVVRIDRQTVGDGKVGPLTQQLLSQYRKKIRSGC